MCVPWCWNCVQMTKTGKMWRFLMWSITFPCKLYTLRSWWSTQGTGSGQPGTICWQQQCWGSFCLALPWPTSKVSYGVHRTFYCERCCGRLNLMTVTCTWTGTSVVMEELNINYIYLKYLKKSVRVRSSSTWHIIPKGRVCHGSGFWKLQYLWKYCIFKENFLLQTLVMMFLTTAVFVQQ